MTSSLRKTNVTGDFCATGVICGQVKTFRIDHPLDPEHQYLKHASVESDELKNVYDGTIVLDENGAASVELPDWFEALNHDFRYQGTCIGGFAPADIAEEITQNHFRIAGGQPGMKVSWQVTGVRHDAFSLKHPLQVEELKPGTGVSRSPI